MTKIITKDYVSIETNDDKDYQVILHKGKDTQTWLITYLDAKACGQDSYSRALSLKEHLDQYYNLT